MLLITQAGKILPRLGFAFFLLSRWRCSFSEKLQQLDSVQLLEKKENMMNKAISAVVLAALVGASCFLCGCYATRNMSTKVELAGGYVLPENEKIPASIGIIMPENARRNYLWHWDLFGGKVYTYDWSKNKLLELGNNYFKKAEITEIIQKGKYDYFAKVYSNIIFLDGRPKTDVGFHLYNGDGLLVNEFYAAGSAGSIYSADIFLYAILEGASLFALLPVLHPLGNYRLASNMDKKTADALHAAYCSLFEDVSVYIIRQQKGRKIGGNEISGIGFAISPEQDPRKVNLRGAKQTHQRIAK